MSTGQRRRIESSLSTRDELIDSTSYLMIERDSVDISLSDISSHANANVALVKYYFGNKEGLLLALLERDVSQATAAMQHLIAADLNPVQKMRHNITGIIRTYHRYPYLNRLLRHVIRDSTTENAVAIARRVVAPICEFYGELIAEGVRQNLFRPIDPMMFYFSVVGACDQMFSARSTLRAVFNMVEMNDDFRQAYTEHTVNLFLNGLIKD